MTTGLCHALPQFYKEFNDGILQNRIGKYIEICVGKYFKALSKIGARGSVVC
jgi:hypothetical protein